MKQNLIYAALAAGFFACAGVSSGTIISTFTDRTSFTGAVGGPVTTETFNSFDSEVPFHTAPLDVGPFTLSMSGSPNISPDRNIIDIPPAEFATFNVDGSNLANVLTEPGVSLFFTFGSAITAFGADFGSINNDLLRTSIVLGGESVSPSVTAGSAVRFFGFTSDTAFTSIEFRGSDGFGIDNVAFGAAVNGVPESGSTLGMLGMVVAGLAMRRRRRA